MTTFQIDLAMALAFGVALGIYAELRDIAKTIERIRARLAAMDERVVAKRAW